MIKILKKLGKEHRKVLEKIYSDFKFDESKKSIINKFVTLDIYKLSFVQCVEWMNLNGIELLRGIYILYFR